MKTVIFILALLSISALASRETMEATPADRVVAKVDQLIARTQKQLRSNEAIHASTSKKCATEKVFRAKEIKQGVKAYEDSQENLALCKSALTTTKPALKLMKNQIEANRLNIHNTRVERVQRHNTFLSRKKQMNNLLTSITQALDIIRGFKNGNAALKFVELGQKVNEIYLATSATEHSTDANPAVFALAELMANPTTVSKASLDKLVGLFRKLENDTKKALGRLVAQDTEDAKTTQVKLHNLNKTLKLQIKMRNSMQSYLLEMNGCVREETRISSLAKAKKIRNTRILKNTVKMCAAFQQSYVVAKKTGTQHVVLLKELRAVIVKAINGYSYGAYHYKFAELEKTHDVASFIQKASYLKDSDEFKRKRTRGLGNPSTSGPRFESDDERRPRGLGNPETSGPRF